MSRSRTLTTTNIALLLFAVLAVGVPYSVFMHQACGSSSVSELVSDIGAFHTREGC